MDVSIIGEIGELESAPCVTVTMTTSVDLEGEVLEGGGVGAGVTMTTTVDVAIIGAAVTVSVTTDITPVLLFEGTKGRRTGKPDLHHS